MKAGWESKIFEDCIEKVTYTTKIQRKDFLDTGTFPIVSQEESFINGYWDGAEDVFRAERPLVVFGDHTKVLKYIDFDFVLGADGVKLLLPKDFLVPKFFYYQLQTAQLDSLGYARHYKLLKELKIKYPNHAEQHRIVALLDEAFAGIATAKANAEKNLQNARALFESHLQSVFTERGEGWVATKLAEVCGFQNGFAFKSSSFKQTGIPIIRISNIQDGRIDTDNRLVFFDPNDYRENLDRYRIIKNDLLIAMSGATTGKLGFNTESTVFYLNQRVGKFEPGEKLNKRFLYYFLSTKIEENLRISAGAAQPNLSTEQIKNFLLPLPPIDEQAHIVESLEELSEETQRLESLYQQKISALDELKQSLLHQAFSGNL